MWPCVHFIEKIKNKHRRINMYIRVVKIIQNESFKDNIFSNRDVNHGSLVTSCSSSDFSPA